MSHSQKPARIHVPSRKPFCSEASRAAEARSGSSRPGCGWSLFSRRSSLCTRPVVQLSQLCPETGRDGSLLPLLLWRLSWGKVIGIPGAWERKTTGCIFLGALGWEGCVQRKLQILLSIQSPNWALYTFVCRTGHSISSFWLSHFTCVKSIHFQFSDWLISLPSDWLSFYILACWLVVVSPLFRRGLIRESSSVWTPSFSARSCLGVPLLTRFR